MTMNEIVGNNIHKYRLAFDYTLEELSALVHKSCSTISKYEKGMIAINADTIGEFAEVFHILPSQLMSVPQEGGTAAEKGEFLDRQYMYTYEGKRKRVMKSIIEQYQSSDAEYHYAQLFYDMEDLKNPGKCKAIYSGMSKKYELWQNYNLVNQKHLIDRKSVV